MISIIIPFHNEKENLPVLLRELEESLSGLKIDNQIILVDDGSNDGYQEVLKNIEDKNVEILVLNRQMGKGRALSEGVKKAKGDLIAFMDADLQDNPSDLSKFLTKINEGYDLVNGYREKRSDNFLVKAYSKTAQVFLKNFLNSPFNDINCGFKLFKRSILDSLPIYGNNFRFLPLAVFYEGFKVAEVAVCNNPRKYGVSKYGAKKLLIGVFDVLSAYFIYKFAERPMHFFGPAGAVFFIMGFFALGIVTYERIFEGVLLYRRPLFQYAIFSVILGIQILATGIIGELIVFLHHKKNKL
jgi:glycosyltransferase involved in cell wall biosynthesis